MDVLKKKNYYGVLLEMGNLIKLLLWC